MSHQAHIALHKDEVVVLIHGLIRTRKSMRGLGVFLEKHGYEVVLYDYPSRKHHISEHGVRLNAFISELLLNHPAKKFHFVTHSLGGIIAREALSKLTKEQLSRCEHLIMLAPPTHGSSLAQICVKWFPFVNAFIRPLPELSASEEAYVHQVAIPDDVKIGVIAGRFDAKTPPPVTHIDGEKDFLIINAAHTFIMNNAKGRKAILNFLRTTSFVD
jgi:pimeloyl-ACP methyl ester carboxylesterase